MNAKEVASTEQLPTSEGGAAPRIDKDDNPVRLGQEALERLKDNVLKSWDDWMLVGEALRVGRQECMDKAGTNKPEGKRYNTEAHQWIQARGFAVIDKSDRAKLLLIIERRPEFELWFDDRAAGATLKYPVDLSGRLQLKYRTYSRAGRVEFVWYLGLEAYHG